MSGKTYIQLGSARTRAVLEEIERVKRTKFHETENLKAGLTVEHVLPDEWQLNWPLADQTTPTRDQMIQALLSINEDESIVGQIVRRNRLKHNVGNLTLLTQPMNSKQSHAAWDQKRQALQDPRHGSLLVLNKEITANEIWDEAAIQTRSSTLFELATLLWPFPANP
jgi:hypothetical protein